MKKDTKHKQKWFIADTHFSHTNSWELFKHTDGTPLRPFSSNEEMDDTIKSNWDSVVNDGDTVYLLGDYVINKRFMDVIKELKGRKKLIMGNHDIFGYQKYIDAGFYDIASYRVFPRKMICSHIPLHTDCIGRFQVNLHGHLHGNVINDPRYLSCSVEQTNFTPISMDEVMSRVQRNKDHYESTGQVINFRDSNEEGN